MKKLLISAIAAGLLLTACANSKTDSAPAPKPMSVEDAMAQCKQSTGEQDRAVFDACMKDKGFQRKAESAAAPEAATSAAQ